MPRKKAAPLKRRNKPPPAVKIRDNSRASASARQKKPDEEQRSLGERVRQMETSHALTGLAAGIIGSGLSVALVGFGWAGPKTTAGVLMGTGAATTAAGYYWDADHAMAAGAGLTTTGTLSLAQQYAVDAYEAVEKRIEEKKASDQKQLAAGQDEKPAKPRNARRFIVVRRDHETYHDHDE